MKRVGVRYLYLNLLSTDLGVPLHVGLLCFGSGW